MERLAGLLDRARAETTVVRATVQAQRREAEAEQGEQAALRAQLAASTEALVCHSY